ncbi:hypothetical protein [Oceanicoccus sp. KOV_DT_Chl]|uniref:hypothetical protein n=1 Tax=Oceanicoccus sp. KOV_DT_Chl TaxID=1904639 RepID=UPI000C7C54EB|nr:hypothetical protein [Oceanicoccus sp. KOV_DT_Chl]
MTELYKNPRFAYLCIAMTLLVMPVAHTASMLLEHIADKTLWFYGHIALGFIGFAVVWVGLKKSEIQACVLGFVGANMMFVGFFELMFALFADVFNVQPILDAESGQVLLTPSLQINEASILIMLPLFLLTYANNQVRCNMIRWVRKILRLDPGRPTEPPRDRPYSRIVAMETLFIIWMIYAVSLLTLDPRVLGPAHPITGLIYLGFVIWPLYLLYRIRKISGAGPWYATRYLPVLFSGRGSKRLSRWIGYLNIIYTPLNTLLVVVLLPYAA